MGLRSDVDEDICDYSTDENDSVEGEPLACDRCCYKTQKKWLMDRHNANHAKDKPFRCPSCRFTDRDASVFVDHLVKHLPKTKIIKCCFCSFKAMPSMMKSHILRHGPTERLDCSECEYWTNSIPSMTDHIEAYHTKKHPCTMCSKILTRYALAKHMKKAHKPRKPSPKVTEDVILSKSLTKTLPSRPGLTIIPVTKLVKTPQLGKKTAKKYLIPTMLPVIQLERCRVPPECWKSLEASTKPLGTRSGRRKSLEQVADNRDSMETGSDCGDALETSLDSQTPVEIPKGIQIRKPIYFPNLVAEFGDTLLTCSICDYQTRKEHLLRRHMDRHDDDLPFVCRKCDFQDISVYEFANHMVITHGSVKDSVYSCCFCNFWTHKKHNIPIHLDRHRGAPKEFDCPECEEVLTSKTGLQSHFEKLHCEALDCQFCGKNMTKFELNLHIKEHADGILESNDQAFEASKEQPGLSNTEAEKSVEISVKPTNPLRSTKYKPKPLSRKKLDMKSDAVVDSGKAKKIEVETLKSAAGGSKYKPKPLSKKKLETQPVTNPPSKTQAKSSVDDEAGTSKSATGSSKYKPKPLSKKKLDTEPEKILNKTPPKSSFNGSENSKPTTGSTESKYQPRSLAKRIVDRSDKAPQSTDQSEEASNDARKRKRSPTPAKAECDSPNQEAGKDLACRYCDYKTQISSLMDRHREKHKADTPFKCTKCKYETLSSYKLSWHYMYHIPSQEEFPCPYCSHNAKNRQSLPIHIERHRSIRFFDCSKCQFSSNHANGVRKHYERMHVDKYGCTICDKVMTKHAMMKHLKKRHPAVYNSPASLSSVEVNYYAKHYLKYMRPISVAANAQKKSKRPKPSADDTEGHEAVDTVGKPASTQADSGIKAAQAALAREIFGDMSDSDDGAQKPSTNAGSSIAASSKPSPKPIIKSEDSDDSDSDSETIVPKLSCPKCDFTTSQITEIKSHYVDMHEVEYACKLCRAGVISTKYELLSHLKKIHPAISPEYYHSNMKCCAPEKRPENKAPVKMGYDDSDDSDNEATAATKIFVPKNSPEPCVPPSSDSAHEKLARSSVPSPPERVELESKATEELKSPVPVDIEEPTVVNEQGSDCPLVPASAQIAKLPESAEVAESANSCEVPGSAICHDVMMELDVTAESNAAPKASSPTEHMIAPHPEKMAVSTTSTSGKTEETQQQKAIKPVSEIGAVSSDITKTGHKCKECNFHASRMSLLQRHSVKHKVGAPLVCPQCQFQNKSPYEFLLHWTKHFPDRKALSCCFCAFATVSKLDLALHFCVHNNTRVFGCNECDYSASTKAFYEGHIWSIHKKVTCQKCLESMAKPQLQSHKCANSKDDDVLSPSSDVREAAAVKEAQESVPGETRIVKMPDAGVVSAGKSCATREPNDHDIPPKAKDSVTSSDLGSAGKQIIAREAFKTELRKFSFLRKRDDFPSADVVSTARSPHTVQHEDDVSEEPSPAFETLSADSSLAEEEPCHAGELMTADNSSKTERTDETRDTHAVDENKEPSVAGKSVVGSERLHSPRVPVDAIDSDIMESPAARTEGLHCPEGMSSTKKVMEADGARESYSARDSNTAGRSATARKIHCQEQAFSPKESINLENTPNPGASIAVDEPTMSGESKKVGNFEYQDGSFSAEHHKESVVAADLKSGAPRIALHSQAEEDSIVEEPVPDGDRGSSNDIELPSADGPDNAGQSLAQEDSFTAAHSCILVPVIDISGKGESPVKAAKPSRPSSTSWTEPIESDEDDENADDHNYFISPKRAKSPAADAAVRADQHQSSPAKSEDFPGDYVTEVVFDNGMTALVLEVSDSSDDEEL